MSDSGDMHLRQPAQRRISARGHGLVDEVRESPTFCGRCWIASQASLVFGSDSTWFSNGVEAIQPGVSGDV